MKGHRAQSCSRMDRRRNQCTKSWVERGVENVEASLEMDRIFFGLHNHHGIVGCPTFHFVLIYSTYIIDPFSS